MSKNVPRDYKAAQKLKDKNPKSYTAPKKRDYAPLTDYKPLPIVDLKTNRLVGLFVFLSALVVYMLTLAKTMSFWDAGEYATCASILGIPHPPGNPFYIVIGRALCAIGGSLFTHAVITAFISALFSAFGVLFTYLITVKLVSIFEKNKWLVVLSGLLAALYTAFAYTHWMTSIEAEVNSGMLFFVNLTLWLTLVWVEKSEDFSHQNILLLIVYSFFLGFCVHQTALQTVPAVMFIILYPFIHKAIKEGHFWLKMIIYGVILLAVYFITDSIGKSISFPDFNKWMFMLVAAVLFYINFRDLVDKKVWLLGIALVGIGLSPHIFLLVRSALRPFINEGYPHNYQLFMDYILRRQYGEISFMVRRATLATQYGFHFLRYFGWQWFNAETLSAWTRLPQMFFSVIGNTIVILFGVLGFFDLAKRNKHAFAYLLSIFIMTTIIFVFVLNLSDTEVRDRDYFFVSAFNIWAIWIGIGCISLIRPFLRKKTPLYVLAGLLLILPLINLASQYNVHDRSKEYMAVDYGMNFLNSLEENAIIFTNGDNDTFPLWYCQAVYDPAVKENIYPAKDVAPSQQSLEAMQVAMEFKNRTLKGIRKDVTVANLSLLNTPWYLRQLRDKEGVLFDWPDSLLDMLSYTPPPESGDVYPIIDFLFKNTTREGDGFNIKIASPIEEQSITLTYPFHPMWRNEGIFRVSDLAVLKLIQDNYGHRPIYFAVTCETYIGFERYTRNEGMVSRVVPTHGADQLDIDRLLNNTDNVYSYRSIKDKRVYKDENMRRLIMNYGAAFDRASSHFLQQGDTAKAKKYMDEAFVFISSEFSKDIRSINLLLQTGAYDEAIKVTREALSKKQDDLENYIFMVKLWYAHNVEITYEIIAEAIRRYPSDYDLAYFIYDVGLEMRTFKRSREMIELMNPNVSNVMSPYLDSLRMYEQFFGSQQMQPPAIE
ncbi:MAG: DUF2723 domain-containing protein [Candidatus Cloacimonadaceae bacterium]